MRIVDGKRILDDIELHLTDAKADHLITSLLDLRDDLANVGMGESHAPLSDGEAEVMVYVYAGEKALASGVADRLSDERVSFERLRDNPERSGMPRG